MEDWDAFFSERAVKGKIFGGYYVGKPSIPRLCPECISVYLSKEV